MPTCYYAHSQSLYNTVQESRDCELLRVSGFTVINPGCDTLQERLNALGSSSDIMEWCEQHIKSPAIDVVAFRAYPDGKIPAGVGKEISAAIACGKPVLELPRMLDSRVATIAQTRQYLREIGHR